VEKPSTVQAPSIHLPGPKGSNPLSLKTGSAATATDRHIIHHHAASAAILQHCGHAIATGLNHFTAFAVAARVSDGYAIFGHLTLAHAHGEITTANHHAVHHHAT
jgi:hypothetical protein